MTPTPVTPVNGKNDVWTHRLCVGLVGACALLAAGGIIVLSVVGKPVPEGLTVLAGGGLGALGGMLAGIMRNGAN